MAEEKKSLFERIYGATKEVLDLAKKPLVKSNLKRKFRSAYDAAESQKIDSAAKLENLREELVKSGDKDNKGINDILAAKKLNSTLTAMQDDIKAEYDLIFGETMKTVED
jgi:hypothetical protein